MQNKGVIRLFAIVFALACLYQLAFTYVTRSVEGDADAFSQGDSQLREDYLDSMRNEVVFNVLIDEFTYSEVKEKEINLGLDLRGGMNVILEVSVKDILKEIANNTTNVTFNEAIKLADANAANSQDNYLDNFFSAFDQVNAESGANLNYSDPSVFGTKEMNDKLGFSASNDAVKAELREN
jgi:SecD/SecF fusion protein